VYGNSFCFYRKLIIRFTANRVGIIEHSLSNSLTIKIKILLDAIVISNQSILHH